MRTYTVTRLESCGDVRVSVGAITAEFPAKQKKWAAVPELVATRLEDSYRGVFSIRPDDEPEPRATYSQEEK